MTDTPASLAALGIKPVAWLYTQDGAPWPIVKGYRYVALEGSGWTETPLYSATDLAPLIAKARRVEALGRIAYGDRWTDPDSPQRIAKDALTALERIDND